MIMIKSSAVHDNGTGSVRRMQKKVLGASQQVLDVLDECMLEVHNAAQHSVT